MKMRVLFLAGAVLATMAAIMDFPNRTQPGGTWQLVLDALLASYWYDRWRQEL